MGDRYSIEVFLTVSAHAPSWHRVGDAPNLWRAVLAMRRARKDAGDVPVRMTMHH